MTVRAAASAIDLAKTAPFALGLATVLPSSCEISAAGQTVSVEPRVMQVLVALAQRQGETVTRDDLIAQCWRGVVVGEDAIQRCIGRLRKTAAVVGGFEIQTLNRVGYRLRQIPAAAEAANSPPAAGTHDKRPTIVVVDMQVFAAGSEVETFAQILAQDLSAALSLNRDLHVLAAHATVSRVAATKEWSSGAAGLRYIAQGTLRRMGEHYRLGFQLLEAASARMLWAHRVDLADIDTPSDDLVIDLAGRMSTEVMRREADRVLRSADELTAWECVVRANTAYQHISLDNLPFAISESRRAVQLDPNYAAAHAALANGLAASYEVGGARDVALVAESQFHCDRAMALDPNDPAVMMWVANALSMTTRPPKGLELARRAAELAPTNPIAHLYLARQYLFLGQPEEAMACLAEHERVAPLFPWQYFIAFNKAFAHFMAGRLDEAKSEIDRAALLNPGYAYTWIAKTILATMAGQSEEALEAVKRLRHLEGDDSLDLQLARIAHSYPEGPVRSTLQAIIADAWGRFPVN
ncbi:MAG: winged helix-turn-helix domain-containing protein [Hoeflea sp.]|uniref:winged helix-turn-helix domain-containing tetratricopeptide repeat protein n=1 Tax=Hoeflea sp. TaxID=1940281 RepID=UPI001DB2882E|nr:tetratricopeptide repeat protein [Hoeflea sp.]MBU4530316.1 winged helix-turn-helix domain-containing protein [Alphaproteobacteria bacterium]MBU4545103.1 winged helix-turn-helix domain-containing protein [Alphaproteobacteria bacterium]MBU4549697.1 winged helix-turn-helix domain-containing protein [Alphaproteobacteria bacterium]MBV1721906.1 winged helix-turn-helix domain-containing protein [Hoeflea sp.]MBV1761256.1 winged helix-turn-helix domain-containing protein [Hoeflea sp.]